MRDLDQLEQVAAPSPRTAAEWSELERVLLQAYADLEPHLAHAKEAP
jgi:hypothetical protein